MLIHSSSQPADSTPRRVMSFRSVCTPSTEHEQPEVVARRVVLPGRDRRAASWVEHQASAVVGSAEAHLARHLRHTPRAMEPRDACALPAQTCGRLSTPSALPAGRQTPRHACTREILGRRAPRRRPCMSTRRAATSDTPPLRSVATPAPLGTRPGCVRRGRQTATAVPLRIRSTTVSSGAYVFLSSFSA